MPASTSPTRGVLLGRERELALLEATLGEAGDGRARFVVVSGEAGIGKTRLLDELGELADGRSCLTLEGRAAEFERELPFGLLTDALDDYLRSLDARAIERLAMDRLGALAVVFPSLRALDEAVEYPVSAVERFRVHHAVRELLERLAVRQPVVLLLDDLQWADGASLELVNTLLRRPPQAAVVLAMAVRAGQGDPATLAAIRGIRRAAAVRSIELGPLSLHDVRELVGGAAGLDLERLHHESGGNPFYALQLTRSGGGAAGPAEPSGSGVPNAVVRAIEAELAALSPGAHGFAEVAAVVGDPFDLDVVAETARSAEERAWRHVDELVSKDLIRETEVPRRLQFRHPLVRHAVYASCSPSVRASGHRRAADALLRRGASPAAVAGHVEQSARHGDAAAIDVLRQAGEQTARQAPTSAARWFAAALRLLPAAAPTGERVTLLTSLAASQAAVGRFADARTALDEAVALLPPSDGELRISLVVGCARLEQLLGHHQESQTRLRRAYEELESPRSPAGVELPMALSASSLYLSDHRGMLEWARAGVDAADAVDDVVLTAAAVAAYAMAASFAGRIQLALELHARAARLVDSLPDDVLTSRLDALSSLATAELYLDRFPESCAHGERALALARASGQTQLLPLLTPILGTALSMVGELRRSAAVLDDAIDAARLVTNAQGLSLNLFNRALCAVLAGDVPLALQLGAESVALARPIDEGVISAFAGAIHAQALLEDGDARGAVDLLLASVGGEEVPLLAGTWRAFYLEVLTRCWVEVGRLDRAEAAAQRVVEQADELGLGLSRLMAERARAAVALARGRPGAAADHALAAASCADEIGARVHAASSRALAGRALAAEGRVDDAVALLERAGVEFDAVGAPRYREQAERELRRLGHAVRRPPRRAKAGTSGLELLTARELEVAELVLDRRTNREIADSLFLSLKTVETHMRHIFEKLGVSSRVEVARVLDRARAAESLTL